jgi:H+/gluconate symporter-like permease
VLPFILSPLEFALLLIAIPPFSLVIGAVIASVVVLVRRRRTAVRGTPDSGLDPGRATLVFGIGALAVIGAVVVEYGVDGYLLNLVDVVAWWRYATPLVAVAVVLAVAWSSLTSGPPTRQRSLAPMARRTWHTFCRRSALIGAVGAVAALLLTIVGAGLSSSSDRDGASSTSPSPCPTRT